MRRLTAWLAGAASGVAAYRLLRRRSHAGAEAPPKPEPAEPDARAEELRARLDESRTAEPEEASPAEQVEPETPEDRRRRVHDEGRAALDEMQSE